MSTSSELAHIRRELAKLMAMVDELREQLRMSSALEDPPMTTEEAAAFLGVKVRTLHNLANGVARRIASHKRGRRLYFTRRDLIAYQTEHRRASQAEIDAMATDVIATLETRRKQKRPS